MTVKQLKEKIQDLPDDMDVLIWVDSDLKMGDDLWALGMLSKKHEISTWYLCQKTDCWQDYDFMCENHEYEIREENNLSYDDEITDEHVDNFLKNIDKIEGIQLRVIPA